MSIVKVFGTYQLHAENFLRGYVESYIEADPSLFSFKSEKKFRVTITERDGSCRTVSGFKTQKEAIEILDKAVEIIKEAMEKNEKTNNRS